MFGKLSSSVSAFGTNVFGQLAALVKPPVATPRAPLAPERPPQESVLDTLAALTANAKDPTESHAARFADTVLITPTAPPTRERALFTSHDGQEVELIGEHDSVGSLLFAAGDQDSDGSVTPLEFASHTHPGLPQMSSSDALFLAARARLAPGRLIEHVIEGVAENGSPARLKVSIRFADGQWRYDAAPAPLRAAALIQLQCAAIEISFSPPHLLESFAALDAAAPSATRRQSLGDTIEKVRQYFIANDLPEASVSWRQANVIGNMIVAYAPTQGLIHATAKAFWIALCANLPEERRTGEFWNGLINLLAATQLPIRPAPKQLTLKQELDRLAMTRVLPFSIDFTKDVDAQIAGYRANLWSEAAQKTNLGVMEPNDAALIFAFSSPDTAVDVLENAFAPPVPGESHVSRSKRQRVYRGVLLLAPYLNGTEPAWMTRALKVFNSATNEAKPEDSFSAAWRLAELIPSLTGEQRKTALETLSDICGKTNLIETYQDKNQRSVLRIELLIQLTDALDEPDKNRILNDCARLLDDRLNAPSPSMTSLAPQTLSALACLARRQNTADRQPTLRRLSTMLSDLLQKKEFNALDTLRRVADVYPLLSDAERTPLIALTETLLDADLNNPANLHVGLLALEGLLATPPNFPGRAQKLSGIGVDLMARALQEDATQNRNEALRLAASFISELNGGARDKAAVLLTDTLTRVTALSGDWHHSTPPALLAFVPENARDGLVDNWLNNIARLSQNTSNSASLWVAAKALQELLPYMGTDNIRWARFVTIAEHLAAAKAFDPASEPLFSAMRGRVAQTLIAAIPYLPAAFATSVQNRLESAQRAYAETSLALDNVTLGGVARIPQDSLQNAEILSDTSLLAARLSENATGIRSAPELKISKHFDRTLVTAHRLLHNTIQALTVNRFVLVTGPSGIGKSEAARYLASELNWPANVFNCSRATTRQHVMQRVGITLNKESGTSRFTVTDGPLADALLNGKLFILNEINLAQPGNLAFLFKILADMEDAFEYYNIRTGKVETRRIHPNFRMLATQNPDGPGRKDLNAALKNRAIEIFTPAYSDAELACLLETKAPELKARFGGDIYGTLVAFHLGISAKIKGRVIGAHDEGYVWNLRHLLRLAEGFTAHPDATPNAASILQIFFDRVGVSLLPRDRQIFFDEIRRHVYGEVSISASDIENFNASLTKIKMTDVYDAFSIPRQQGAAAAAQFKISDMPTSARYLRSILASFNAGYHVWLKGPAGTGKTRLAQFAAKLTGTTFFSDTFTPQTDEAQLKGEFRPRILTSEDGVEKLGFEYVPAPLVLALRHAAKHRDQKTVCLLDEAAFAKPDVLEELNSLIDRDGGLWLLSEDGERIEFLECPDNFRLILASNTYGYSGVQLQSEALRSRTQEIFMDFEYSGTEIDTFMARFISPFAEVSLDDLPDTPPGELEPALAAPAAPALSPNGGITTAPLPIIIPPPGAPADPTDVPTPRAAFGGFGVGGKPPLIRYAERFAQGATTPRELNLTPAEQLKAAGVQLPDEVVALIDARFNDLSRRLLGEAVSSGRDPDISIVFDPKTKTASMSAEKPRTFKIGPFLLAKKDVEDLLNVALHEGSHADISRVGTGFFYDNKIANALLGVVEDMRVNARAMERTPGRAVSYRAMLKHDYGEQFDALKEGEFPKLLPHEGFLDALLAIEYGGDSVWLDDPVVGKALRDAAPSVAKAIAARPREANPSEESVRLHFARFETILKNEILPIYEKLVALSREELEKRQQKSGKDKKSDDNNGDDTMESRAEKISEALGSPGASGKNGKGTGKDQKDAAQGESATAPGDDGKPAKPQNGSQAPEGKEDQPNPNDAADALKNMARARQKTENADKEWLQNNAYSDLMKDLSTLADRVFAVFDRLLKPNADPENDEHFFSGNDLDIDRAVRITMGLSTDMRAFLRPSDPQARSYRFSLLLDASGSMNRDTTRKRGGLGLAALFVDVFERLGLPYGIDAFHDKYIPLKDFSKNLKLAPKRNEFFNDVVKNVFGKGSTAIRLGMIGALDRIRKERKTNPRGTEFLFVLTDGEEEIKIGTPIREQCLKAAKEGIIVVGIGIGEGMGMARKHFPVNLVTDDPEKLPALIAEFIKRYAQAAIEE